MDGEKAVNFARGFLQKAENDFIVAKEYLEKCNKSIGDSFYEKMWQGKRGTYVILKASVSRLNAQHKASQRLRPPKLYRRQQQA